MKLLLAFITLLFTSLSISAAQVDKYHYLDKSEIEQIQIQGETSTVLVSPWRGMKKLGAVIILPTQGEGADAAGLVAHLRREIAPLGWTSLSLESPQAIPQPNFATSADEVAKAGTKQLSHPKDESMPDYSEEGLKTQLNIQTKYLIASLNQLDDLGNKYPGARMLVVSNAIAGLTISLLNEKKIPQPDILVVINPYLMDPKQNATLPTTLGKLTIPTLDIQTPDANGLAQQTAAQRREKAPFHRPKLYEQRMLGLNLDTPPAWQACLELIEAFAYRIAK